MQRKTQAFALLERLAYWEQELDLEPSPHPDADKRLDHIIETSLRDETRLMQDVHERNLKIAEQSERIKELQALAKQYSEEIGALKAINTSVKARNRALEHRWTQLRELLGIANKHEEEWL